MIKQMKLLENLNFFRLVSFIDNNRKSSIILTSLTIDEEKDLDSGKQIVIERGKCSFLIKPINIIAYGIIDFNNGSDDMKVISKFNFLSHLTTRGVVVPANYNYKHHCAYSDIHLLKIYDTTRPEVIAQYGHGCIGKPTRSLIFKHMG